MKIPVDTCADLIDALRRDYPARHSIFLLFEKCSIEVRINNLDLVDKLKRYFKPFVSGSLQQTDMVITVHQAEVEFDTAYTVKQPDPGKTKIKEEYVDLADGRIVRKRLTGMHFIFDGEHNLAVGPCLENDNQVVNFINNRFIEWKLKQGCLLGHAAGVTHKDHGLALAGFSGMGKSTLALHLMSRAARFVSNDRLLIERDGESCKMSGVAKLPRVNPGTVLHNNDLDSVIPADQRRQFAQLTADKLWALEHKFDADIEECFGPDRFVLSAAMTGLIILNWQRDQGSVHVNRVNLAERPDLLPAFMKGTGLFYLPKGDEPRDFPAASYLEMLRDVTVIELHGGIDFERAADICMDFLEDS